MIGHLNTPSSTSTLVDLLRLRAEEQPHQLGYTFLIDGETREAHLSYEQLDLRARSLGSKLQQMGLAGARVLLLCPTGLDYIASFFGCVYAGAIAVPAYPPQPGHLDRTLPRLEAIAVNAQPAAAIASPDLIARADEIMAHAPSLKSIAWIASDVTIPDTSDAWTPPEVTSDSLAFLQYTSGSTASAKGVMVSHGNLLHNLQQIYRRFAHGPESKGVIWLPPYHDMGLIGGILQPLYGGFPVILMSPVSFLQQPLRWLEAISRSSATTSGGPNFAYDLCVRKTTPAQRATLDLSSWKLAFNGAEPVRADVLDRFAEAFEPCGFRREAFYPTYGLAEATLIVAGASDMARPQVRTFTAAALQSGHVVEAAEDHRDVRRLVGCGASIEGQQIAIVDPEQRTRSAPEQIGEIWVAGPSVARGYWGMPDESDQTFRARIVGSADSFLRTGDLGFLRQGELFITGRLKDLIIVRGRNHYPQDIEQTVEQSHRGLRAGASAAFSVEVNGEERVVVVQEVDRHYRKYATEELINAIRRAVSESHELQLYSVALLKPGHIPKTSSGKIQRHLCRQGFLSGTLEEVGRSMVEEQEREAAPAESETFDPQTLRSATPAERQAYLEAYLQRHLSDVTDSAADLDAGRAISSLGLDSLAAIELQYVVEQELGVSLPMARLLQDASITELAAQLGELLHEAALPPAAPPSDTAPRLAQLPLSHGQRALWVLHQLAPESMAYTIARAVRLRAPSLDRPALQRAFQALVDRHAALRIRFATNAGEPVQIVDEQVDVFFETEDATSWDTSVLTDRLAREAQRPFDLLHGPLLRVYLFTCADDEHVLLLTLHHIIADLQSLAVMIQELSVLYGAARTGSAAQLPQPRLDYSDYVARQAALLASPAADRLWRYWQSQLAGELPVLHLPLDRPRPALQTYRGASYTLLLDDAMLRGLHATGRRDGATLFMTLAACFGVLLYRYTGQEDLLLGTPTTGRSQADLSDIVGYFVNPVPLRLDLAGAPSFEQLLRQVRQTVLQAFEHQDYPFDLLVSRLRPDRDARRASLVQAMFVMQHTRLADTQGLAPFALDIPEAHLSIDNLIVESLPLDQQAAQFDLTLTAAETQAKLGLVFTYNSDLFDAATIERMAGHFTTLLSHVIANPASPIHRLPLLTAYEQQQQLGQWANSSVIDHPVQCLHHLFELQASRAPEAIALVDETQRLSYGELNRRANQLAHYLRSRGIGPETLIGLCMGRSNELIIAMLAILKAGAAYLPIDPIYPAERLAFMLHDAQAPLLITETEMLERAAAYSGQIICLEQHAALIEREPDTNPESVVTAEHLAYVIYTSGSTGKPKGSLITHANVARLFAATQPWFQFGSQDVWTLFHSYAFDFSVWEIWGALLHGSRLVIVSHSLSRAPDLFYHLLQREQVTVLNQTPSAFQQLIQAEDQLGVAEDLALRLVIFGGEALDLQSLQPWLARHGDRSPQLVNMYGITETTVHVTYRPLQAADMEHSLGSRIGGPIPDLELYVLDQQMQPAPDGVPGELYVGGPGLARGYLGRPGLTAERFVPHPFTTVAGARLYRTGDLARSRANGDVEYLGRIDRQVKLRGFRIELREIEAVLRQHPGVRDLAVLTAQVLVDQMPSTAAPALTEQAEPAHHELRPFIKSELRQPSGMTEQRLIAYVVCQGDTQPTVSELRRFMQEMLPEYMIPAVFVFLPALPLTEHGKLDRKALPALDRARPSLEKAFVPPRTAAEQTLARVWGDVLEIGQVGIHDNFFELGGDSIRGLRVRAQAEAQGLHFSLQQLFQHQNIAALAEVLDATAPPTDILPATAPFSLLLDSDRSRLPADVIDAYPLARMQAGVIFHCQLEPDSPLYHDIFIYRIRVPFDAELFRAAIQQVIDRHAVLRTSFNVTDYSEPLQLVHRAVTAPLTVEDLRGLTEQAQREFQATWIEQEKQHRFAWETPPLIRFALHRVSDDVCDLIISFHDTIFDGWSTASLLTELMLRYDGLLNSRMLPTDPPVITYRDFVAQERQIVASEAARRFWRESLHEAVTTPLPQWPRASDAGVAEVSVLDVPITASLSDGLKALARAAQVPLKHVLLAAHMKVMSLLAGQDEIISGLETNGRIEAHDGEKTIGVHLNMLPFRLRLESGSWLDLIRQVFAAELAIIPFRHYPLAELQRERRGQPWFETVFNYTHFHVFEELRELRSLEVIGGRGFGQTHFTLLAELNLNTFSGQLQVDLIGNLKVLDRAQLAAIGSYYAEVLNTMVAAPTEHHESRCLLPRRERERTLISWNQTGRSYPHDRCIHHLFEEQVAQTPETIALVSEQTSLTYAELNQHANQLAHHLQALGVGPETRVALCTERSPELLIGLLGILKAGGAYVPLDPTYPQERLAFMLEDCRASVVVTQAHLLAGLPELEHVSACLIDRLPSSAASFDNPRGAVIADNLAYVIYTSGSTGRPKGVQISHRALVNCLTAMRDQPGVHARDRLLSVTTLSFDIAGLELYLPLISGAQIILSSKAVAADGVQLAALLHKSQATVMQATPATWRLLLAAGWTGQAQLKVLCGGEAMPPELADQLLAGGVELWNMYGPTETTIWSAIARIDRHEVPITVGRPIANTQMYILDSWLQPVPVGVTGDLYIGGDGLARGYLGRPALTAERFIPNPFSSAAGRPEDARPGARLYAVGDRARYLPDGRIEVLGRNDQQIKLRGFRIELQEIEAELTGHPAVEAAAVTVFDERLVAYVVREPGATSQEPEGAPRPAGMDQTATTDGAQNSVLGAQELRAFLKQQLPEYMVPTGYVFLDRLPLTPNGKIDRRALPAPDAATPETTASYVAPRTALETELAQLWAEIFGVKQVGIHDDFFTLGGHSLLATQLIIHARQRFHVDIPLSMLFSSATVAGMAVAIEQLQATLESSDDLAQMLDELDNLSDEDVRARLLADF